MYVYIAGNIQVNTDNIVIDIYEDRQREKEIERERVGNF